MIKFQDEIEGQGYISLKLWSGAMISKEDHGEKKFVHDFVDISGVPNVLEIEKICRERVKENNPTPANIVENE